MVLRSSEPLCLQHNGIYNLPHKKARPSIISQSPPLLCNPLRLNRPEVNPPSPWPPFTMHILQTTDNLALLNIELPALITRPSQEPGSSQRGGTITLLLTNQTSDRNVRLQPESFAHKEAAIYERLVTNRRPMGAGVCRRSQWVRDRRFDSQWRAGSQRRLNSHYRQGRGGGGDTGSGRGGGDWAWLGPAGASCRLDRPSGESAPSPRAQPKPGPAWPWATRPRPRRAVRSRAVSVGQEKAKAGFGKRRELLREARAGASSLRGKSRAWAPVKQEVGWRVPGPAGPRSS